MLQLVYDLVSYAIVIFVIILAFFIYISFVYKDQIIEVMKNKIKEKRREFIKIALQDISLFIQVTLGMGISLLLFSLSLSGTMLLIWGILGFAMLGTSIYLLIWRYLPLRNKIYDIYNEK